ncbi:MAG: Eco29kI family restriction endonuclease [Anaerolineae bacterium]|nr:Eco29kI family restriction endonuclease [Anaerolineae bacterium]
MSLDYTRHIFRSPEFQSVVGQAIHFFDATPDHALPIQDRFIGCGVYGLYYTGSHLLYTPLSQANRVGVHHPIYVGKAVTKGWRTGRTIASQTTELYSRLREHARSIRQGNGLSLDDFRCRFMILENMEADLIIPVEAELIRRYRPLWNTVVDGFGNHDPGSGRYEQAPSEWDVLHTGRPWVRKLTGNAPQEDIIVEKVRSALSALDLA